MRNGYKMKRKSTRGKPSSLWLLRLSRLLETARMIGIALNGTRRSSKISSSRQWAARTRRINNVLTLRRGLNWMSKLLSTCSLWMHWYSRSYRSNHNRQRWLVELKATLICIVATVRLRLRKCGACAIKERLKQRLNTVTVIAVPRMSATTMMMQAIAALV